MELKVQQIPESLYSALGITNRQGFAPRLQEGVSIVIAVPLNIGSANALGFNDGETDNLAGWSATLQLTADAANLRHVQVLNPTGSGEVVYIDRWSVRTVNADDMCSFAFYNTGLTSVSAGLPLPKYAGSSATFATQIRSQSAAAALSASIFRVVFGLVARDEWTEFNPPVRLDAGSGMIVFGNTVNRGLSVNIEGRKYAAV